VAVEMTNLARLCFGCAEKHGVPSSLPKFEMKSASMVYEAMRPVLVAAAKKQLDKAAPTN